MNIYLKTSKSLFNYCYKKKFKGYDPFDGLNSAKFKQLIGQNKYTRLATIQFFKRFPINLRPLFGISKEINPKGIALALSTAVRVEDKHAKEIFNTLKGCRIKNYNNFCIGYNFDWQNRVFFLPKGTPTVVNTAFAGHAFLDYYYHSKEEEALSLAVSCCEFILNDLNIQKFKIGSCVSYSPLDLTRVHNANLLAAGILARTFNITGNEKLITFSKSFADYSLSHQSHNGSWVYGKASSQQFIDSFHTGFNLEQLFIINSVLNDKEYERKIEIGHNFYIKNFFEKSGVPKYYHNKIYPIDSHSPAQFFSYCGTRDIEESSYENVFKYTLKNLIKDDVVIYRKNRFINNNIPYMRWSQLWMAYGLSKLVRGFLK